MVPLPVLSMRKVLPDFLGRHLLALSLPAVLPASSMVPRHPLPVPEKLPSQTVMLQPSPSLPS
ncbi:hypothetical protein BDQ17DRAFT_1342821 [Cyathus striatus]|nr:hypothetical protein BDQ17DRAFT_1342821 [Cyathus striatus]